MARQGGTAWRTVAVFLPEDDELALSPLVSMLPPAVLRADVAYATRIKDAHQCGQLLRSTKRCVCDRASHSLQLAVVSSSRQSEFVTSQ